MKLLFSFLASMAVVSLSPQVQAGMDISTDSKASNFDRGMPRHLVISHLGEPNGSAAVGSKEILTYPGVELILRNGVIENINLRPIRKNAHSIEGTTSIENQFVSARIRRGEKLKSNKQIDPTFLNASAHDQLAYWRRFTKVYPEIDVSPQMSLLASRLQHTLSEPIVVRTLTGSGDACQLRRKNEFRRIRSTCKYRKRYHTRRAYPANRGYKVTYYNRNNPGSGNSSNRVRYGPQNPVIRQTTATPPNPFPTFFAAEIRRF